MKQNKGNRTIRNLIGFANTRNVILMAHVALAENHKYRDADKSLALPTFRYILFDGSNISFDASLVLYIYIYIYIYINCANIPQIMIINRIYEN
jgi:hypothetical protein